MVNNVGICNNCGAFLDSQACPNCGTANSVRTFNIYDEMTISH